MKMIRYLALGAAMIMAPPAFPEELPRADPASVGLSAEHLDRVDAVL